jgi:nicotinate phosphoribosyltransferase
MRRLPKKHEQYADKYFLRSKQILQEDEVNPFVRMQVFIRKGPGTLAGIDEAVAILDKYSDLREHGGVIRSLPEGSTYGPGETVMTIDAPLQDIIDLETMYLGVISAETTLASGGTQPSLKDIEARTREIVELCGDRPVMYFGARHWRYDKDKAIAKAAFKGGAKLCSTDVGASVIGEKGVGTIPHALVLAYGSTLEAAKAFDKYIDPDVPRVVLVDTFNKEITDTLECAEALDGRLSAVRLDTCGENVAELASPSDSRKFYGGTGVTIDAAYQLRTALDAAGYSDVKIVLSSGFGNVEKVRAFVEAEKELGVRLFDSVGVGGLYTANFATADIVRLDGEPFSKAGRYEKPNERLVEV